MLQLTFGASQNLVDPALLSGVMLGGVKFLFLLGVLTYFVFSIVVVRQIVVMKKTLITSFSPLLQVVGWGHLVTVGFFGLVFLLIL